jgi:hypothetical protein
MKEQYNLSREVFPKSQYQNTINTSFTQLITPSSDVTASELPTVNQFFDFYNQLFFDIPKFGETNSHEYLIKTSTEYIGETSFNNSEIQALLEEITDLRGQVLSLSQQLAQSQ